MPTIASAVVRISADIGDFDKGLQKAQKALLKTADQMASWGNKLSIGFTAPLLAASAVLAKSAAEDAASVRKLEVAFGSGSAAMEKFVTQMMKVTPATDDQLRQIVANTQAFNLSLGQTPQKAQAMTQAITKLAADIAAYNGVDLATAQEAVTSAMAGRTKALKSLNVVVSEAEIKESGLAAIQARSAIMQGYAAKTIGDDVNAWARFKQSLDSASDSMGAAVLPTFAKVLDVAGKLAQQIAGLDDGTKHFVVSAGILVAALGPLLVVSANLTRAYVALKAAVMALTSEGFAAMALAAAPVAAALGVITLGVVAFRQAGEAARTAKQDVTDYASALDRLSAKQLQANSTRLRLLIGQQTNANTRADSTAAAEVRGMNPLALAGFAQSGGLTRDKASRTLTLSSLNQMLADNDAALARANAAASPAGGGNVLSDMDAATSRADALAKALDLLRQRNISVIQTTDDMAKAYALLQKQIDGLNGKNDTASIVDRNKLLEAQNALVKSADTGPALSTAAMNRQLEPLFAPRLRMASLTPTNALPTQNVDPWTALAGLLPKKLSDTEKAMREGLANVSVAIGQTLADKLVGSLVGRGGGANFGGNLGGQFGARLGDAATKASTSLLAIAGGPLLGGLLGTLAGGLFGGLFDHKKKVDASSEALQRLAITTERVNAALTNLPSGIKIDPYRYWASQAETSGPMGPGGGSLPGTPRRPGGTTAASIIIQSLTVLASSPGELARELSRASETEIARAGSSMPLTFAPVY